jgi:hypothetical protein
MLRVDDIEATPGYSRDQKNDRYRVMGFCRLLQASARKPHAGELTDCLSLASG